MKKKSIVLLSGGLDSAVNFKKAWDETEVTLVLTFDYGQESRQKEMEASAAITKKHNIPHQIIRLDFLEKLDTGLTKGKIPDFDRNKLDDLEYSTSTAKAVWVPNRNGIFLNIAAAFADQYHIDSIITGFNKEEGATFSDNTQEFLDRTNAALEYSTLFHPKSSSYTIGMTKNEIVALGIKIGAPLEHVWSCYHSGARMCGKCESCQRLIRALDANSYLEKFKKINTWGIL